MLSITWTNYFLILSAVVAIYYAVILLIYYRAQLSKLLKGKQSDLLEVVPDSEDEDGTSGFEGLEQMVEKIRDSMIGMAGEGEGAVSKEELIKMLHHHLANYEGLRRPAYRSAVTHYIIDHAKDICGVVFSEEELKVQLAALPR